MMNYVWSGMILLSCVIGMICSDPQTLTRAVLEGAQSAVTMVLELLGMMCFWTGMLEIAKRSGLTEKLAKLLSPVIRFLFPRLSPSGAAASAIVMNMTANFLGLSNAATPLGLKAMQELKKLSRDGARATDEMCMFVVINTASISLIPTTLFALRMAAGSADPFSVTVPVWISSALSVTVGVLAAKLFARREARGKKCRS